MSWLDALFPRPAGRMIPEQLPRLLWEAELPKTWSDFLDVPVISRRGLVLFTAGEERGGAETALVAIDAATGVGRWTLRLAEPANQEFYTGLPLALPDGGAVVAAHWQNEKLSLLGMSADGQLLPERPIVPADDEDDKGTRGYDGSSKLFLGPTVQAGPDRCLVSWLYRQVRYYRTECRSVGGGALLWGSEEWMLGMTEGVVLGQASRRAPDDPFRLIARGAVDGGERWSRSVPRSEANMPIMRLACVPDGSFVFAETTTDGEGLIALEAATGRELWRLPLPGAVSAASAAAGVVAITTEDQAGTHRAHRFTAGGATIADNRIGGPWSIAAIDHTNLIWKQGADLVCEPLADPGQQRWRISLPEKTGAHSFRPRSLDRFKSPEVSVSALDGLVVIRSGTRAWAFGP